MSRPSKSCRFRRDSFSSSSVNPQKPAETQARMRRRDREEDSQRPSSGNTNILRDGGSRVGDGGGRETLADISKKTVDKIVRRVNARGGKRKKKKKEDDLATHQSERRNEGEFADKRVTWNDLDSRHFDRDSSGNDSPDGDGGLDDVEWEDGSTLISDSKSINTGDGIRTVTIEFNETPDFGKRKPVHRASAEDKEVAELVHKVHLLCLLARGRIIDSACDDPLLQASILSILPEHFLKISEISKLAVNSLSPLVSWFHNNFRVRSSAAETRSFHSALACSLETREGTQEEIAALSVVLFRALKLTTRFVSILDVVSIKPDGNRCEVSSQDPNRARRGIFSTSTLMVDRTKDASTSSSNPFSSNDESIAHQTSLKSSCRSKDASLRNGETQTQDSASPKLGDQITESGACEVQDNVSEPHLTTGPKRKGDIEFEMQLQMALSATAVMSQSNTGSEEKASICDSSNIFSPFKKMRRVASKGSPSQGISTAVGSTKVGSPLFWAEVFCNGENLAGKWVHIDAINAIVDGEHKVEDAAAACKTSLRYVIAFAGHGAKDVTRRYCMKWHKIAPQRVSSAWWEAVLVPLRELESGATGAPLNLEKNQFDASNEHEKGGKLVKIAESSVKDSCFANRSSLEDMELETRALTEPLPTNQQAYKNHQLYAIERWLTKHQILHPKGPVLGFCSGHPVYPRACVQTLKSRERWLREGLQVKAQELPAKVLKQPGKLKKAQSSEDGNDAKAYSQGILELYGRWQLESLQLTPALNGIVPKNERGQVEVWSEKCLPPGTVHLKWPKVHYVAKRLEIDYAPAMVGFDFRNGRSVPVFDGIVVCSEFKHAILEAYAEEEERRQAEEKKRNEAQAIARWYQLLSSIVTRQRLDNLYGNSSPSQTPTNDRNVNAYSHLQVDGRDALQSLGRQKEILTDPDFSALSKSVTEDHEHVFLAGDQSFDEETSTTTKRCRCGFSIQVEEF